MKINRKIIYLVLVVAVLAIASRIFYFPNKSISIQVDTGVNNVAAGCGNYTVRGEGGIIYGTVLGEDGECWLDRNLGATATTNDIVGYGYYYQWGRLTDGHQVENSGVTKTLSSTDIPGHAKFITNSNANFDWKTNGTRNDELWRGNLENGGVNNPCPIGWRLPTGGLDGEWGVLIAAAGITDPVTAYNSKLKLTQAGWRIYSDAKLYDRGSDGYYWSSSPSGAYASLLRFYSGKAYPANTLNRANGFSVRCVKN